MSSRATRMAFITFMHQVGDITSQSDFDNVFDSNKDDVAEFLSAEPEQLFIPPNWLTGLFTKMKTNQEKDDFKDFESRLFLHKKLKQPTENPNKLKHSGNPSPRTTNTKPAASRGGAYGPKIKPLPAKEEPKKTSIVPVLEKQPFPAKEHLAVVVETALKISKLNGNTEVYSRSDFIAHLQKMIADVNIQINNFEVKFFSTKSAEKYAKKGTFKFTNSPKFM